MDINEILALFKQAYPKAKYFKDWVAGEPRLSFTGEGDGTISHDYFDGTFHEKTLFDFDNVQELIQHLKEKAKEA